MSAYTTLLQRTNAYLQASYDASRDLNSAILKAKNAQEMLNECVKEQDLCVGGLQALKDIRPLMAASSVEKAENLANMALEAIFQTNDKVKFVDEDQRFIVETGEGDTDLLLGNGGGYQAVISFIFQMFLLMKSKARLFLAMDEAFTQLSDDALQRFIEFLRNICKSMEIDLLLITHDARISNEDVDHVYFIEDNHATKIK